MNRSFQAPTSGVGAAVSEGLTGHVATHLMEFPGVSVLANGLGSDAFLAVRPRKSLHRITARKFGILNEPGLAPYESG